MNKFIIGLIAGAILVLSVQFGKILFKEQDCNMRMLNGEFNKGALYKSVQKQYNTEAYREMIKTKWKVCVYE